MAERYEIVGKRTIMRVFLNVSRKVELYREVQKTSYRNAMCFCSEFEDVVDRQVAARLRWNVHISGQRNLFGCRSTLSKNHSQRVQKWQRKRQRSRRSIHQLLTRMVAGARKRSRKRHSTFSITGNEISVQAIMAEIAPQGVTPVQLLAMASVTDI